MHHTEDTRAFFMVSDCRFVMPDDAKNPEVLSEGEVQIFDMKGTTMRHISRLTISTLRAYIKFLQLAYPVRLRAIHMINCPSYLDRIVSVVKPFISEEVFKLVGFYRYIIVDMENNKVPILSIHSDVFLFLFRINPYKINLKMNKIIYFV